MTQAHTFTPGPWTVGQDGNLNFTVKDETGFNHALMRSDFSHPTNRQHANALLIATAPDLLAALQEVVEQPTAGWSISDAVKIMERCRAAIAKATGGAQ